MPSRSRRSPLVAEWTTGARSGWPVGGPLYRAHSAKFSANTFNPSPTAHFRFSPIVDSNGDLIPSWYGGSNPECAVAETLLHDIPIAGGGTLRTPQFVGRRISSVQPTRTLRLARLDTDGLRALSIKPADATDTEADRYPHTRNVAQKLHDTTDLDGLVWMSRRRNIDTAVVLYADRVDVTDLEPAVTVRDFDTDDGWQWLSDTLEPLNVYLAPPRI